MSCNDCPRLGACPLHLEGCAASRLASAYLGASYPEGTPPASPPRRSHAVRRGSGLAGASCQARRSAWRPPHRRPEAVRECAPARPACLQAWPSSPCIPKPDVGGGDSSWGSCAFPVVADVGIAAGIAPVSKPLLVGIVDLEDVEMFDIDGRIDPDLGVSLAL